MVLLNTTENMPKNMPTQPQNIPAQLPPVPPKPDLGNVARAKKAHIMNIYYAEHKAAILADFEKLGDLAMRKRWGIRYTTWAVLRSRWMPDRFEPPSWYGKKRPQAGKPSEKSIDKVSQSVPGDTEVHQGISGSGLKTEPPLKVVHIFQVPGGFPPFERCCNDAQVTWLEVYRDLALHSTEIVDLEPQRVSEAKRESDLH